MKATQEQVELREKARAGEFKIALYSVDAYNSKRYSKPWIALITGWPVGSNPVLRFGASSKLDAEVGATVGALVYYGQKDNRKPNWSKRQFALVGEAGNLIDVTPAQARELYRQLGTENTEPMINA